jgi:hypothetical protein
MWFTTRRVDLMHAAEHDGDKGEQDVEIMGVDEPFRGLDPPDTKPAHQCS